MHVGAMEVLGMMQQEHIPAMLPQEAAMLPALLPGHFTMQLKAEHFVPAEAPQQSERRGSPAGRAILHAGGVNLPGVQPMRRE